MQQRHKPKLAEGRCCWVCGRPGGAGFTTALRHAGYAVPSGAMAYAHNRCMQRAQKRAAAKKRPQCPWCGMSVGTGSDGKLFHHGTIGWSCEGSGKRPEDKS